MPLCRGGLPALFLAALLLAGCGKKEDNGRAALVLGDQVGLSRAKVDAADAFRGVPFDYKWALFPGAAPLFEALAAGAVDTAPAGDTPVIAAAAAKAPIRIIAATRGSGKGVAILVPPGSPIRTVKDLRGRQVIVSSARGSVAQYLLLGALREAGVAPSTVKIGFMLPGEAMAAFNAGRIDAWATFGTYQANAMVRGARVLRDGQGINSSLAFLTASASALADPAKRAAIVDYLRRQRTANQWAAAHPDAYTRMFARVTGVEPEVARLVVTWENPDLLPPDAAIMGELQRVADTFHAEGVLPAAVTVRTLVDDTIFRDAVKPGPRG